MISRIFTILVLIAFITLTLGCTRYAIMSIDEVKARPDMEYSAAKLPVFIEGIALPTGEEIIFKESTGCFDEKTNTITGVAPDSTLVEKNLDEIDFILLKRMTVDGPQVVMVDVSTFKRNAAEYPWKSAKGYCLQDGELIRFSPYTGKYDSGKQVIRGACDMGKYIEIKLNDVQIINAKPNPSLLERIFGTTVFAVVLGIAFMYLLLAIIGPIEYM